MTEDLLTRWGRALDPAHPLPEHPRPQLVRDEWLSLNGRWDYAITPEDTDADTGPASYDGTIIVPFSPEAPLSGVGRQLQPDQTLWYRRTFAAPARRPDGRTLLHFGAVDQSCTVWLNGVEIGSHVGGYLPFTLDVTDQLTGGEETLVVRVADLSETGAHARGKQRLDRGGIWYTAQSGIWQTVWVESVPAAYVERLDLVPELTDLADLAGSAVDVTVVSATDGAAQVIVRCDGAVIGSASTITNQATRILIPDVHPWSPDDPFLYDLEVRLGDDRVASYVGMRSFGIGPDASGVPRLLLNGKPFTQVGVLDQGYWPDGLMTAPSDAAMVHDLETARRMGFTMVRKHVKVEPLRWYHHCDRLGLLVWQDLVNGGGRYRNLIANLPARHDIRIPDRFHSIYHRHDAAGREEFREEVRATIALLRNVVSLAVWVPFNEGWGQFDANAVAAAVARLDPTRHVNHVSGWIDQGGGDIRSFHEYLKPFRLPRRRRRDRRVLALSEYGGYNLRVEGHSWNDKDFGYRRFDSASSLRDALADLHHEQIAPAVRAGLAATVYTQLTDVEDELNGLLTYDREVLKLPVEEIRAIFRRLR